MKFKRLKAPLPLFMLGTMIAWIGTMVSLPSWLGWLAGILIGVGATWFTLQTLKIIK